MDGVDAGALAGLERATGPRDTHPVRRVDGAADATAALSGRARHLAGCVRGASGRRHRGHAHAPREPAIQQRAGRRVDRRPGVDRRGAPGARVGRDVRGAGPVPCRRAYRVGERARPHVARAQPLPADGRLAAGPRRHHRRDERHRGTEQARRASAVRHRGGFRGSPSRGRVEQSALQLLPLARDDRRIRDRRCARAESRRSRRRPRPALRGAHASTRRSRRSRRRGAFGAARRHRPSPRGARARAAGARACARPRSWRRTSAIG